MTLKYCNHSFVYFFSKRVLGQRLNCSADHGLRFEINAHNLTKMCIERNVHIYAISESE